MDRSGPYNSTNPDIQPVQANIMTSVKAQQDFNVILDDTFWTE